MSNKKCLDAEPFSYLCKHGTWFHGTRCDLSDGVVADKPLNQIHHEDFVCFGAWHRDRIHSDLSGFKGYDCVNFRYEAPKHEEPEDAIAVIVSGIYGAT
jgi:hypothetical protein